MTTESKNGIYITLVYALLVGIIIILAYKLYVKNHEQKIIVTETKSQNDNARFEANEVHFKFQIDSLIKLNEEANKRSEQKQVKDEKDKIFIKHLPPDSGLQLLLWRTDSLARYRYHLN